MTFWLNSPIATVDLGNNNNYGLMQPVIIGFALC